MPVVDVRSLAERVGRNVEGVIVGKHAEVQLTLAALLCRGHVLIEDVPGVGKTVLAKAIARSIGCVFKRIQFTPDLLPTDVTGVSIYNQKTGEFEYRSGPVMAQIVLADEINRATPKTQSALLEAMEEHQVTIEGETRRLPQPFFVIATQNPVTQVGTFPLPESQLDRFLMRIHLGYPDAQAERALLQGENRRELLATLGAAFHDHELATLQGEVQHVRVSAALLDYVQAIVDYTRRSAEYASGLSPRAALGLLHAARAWALIAGRRHVIPEDVQAVLPGVVGHRLAPGPDAARLNGSDVARHLLEEVAVP